MGRGKAAVTVLTPHMHLLGKIPDTDLARMAGCSREYVRQQRVEFKIKKRVDARGRNAKATQAEYDARIAPVAGAMTDGDAAAKLGMACTTIIKYRHRHGIPAYGHTEHRVKWMKELLAKMGKIPDTEMARLAGCAIITAWRKRRSMGKKRPAGRPKKNAES